MVIDLSVKHSSEVNENERKESKNLFGMEDR